MQNGRRIGLAVLSGILLIGSFPPFNLFPLAWIALIPLLAAVQGSGTWKTFALVFCSMSIFFLEFLHWLSVFGWYAWVAGAFYEALFPAFWGFLIYPWISGQEKENSFENIIIPAVSYVAMEALRNLGPLGMPWGDLAYTQWKFLPLIQSASLAGALGVSFLVALLNFFIFYAVQTKKRRWAAGALACLVFPILFGMIRLQRYAKEALPVALIQTDDIQLFKWSQAHYRDMLSEMDQLVSRASAMSPRLIVFPETSLAGYFNEDPVLQALAQSWAQKTKTFLAVGTLWNHGGKQQNALVLVSPQANENQVYAKIKLVPFGEYLPFLFRPFRGHWHVLDPIVDDQPGTTSTIFNLPQADFGAMICFESSFGWMARKLVLGGARFLVVSTNDAWFYETLAQETHAVMAVYRAIETGRSCVQAGNTGISCAVDGRGRILAWNNEPKSAVIDVDLPLEQGLTLYDRIGDVFPYACIAVTGLWGLKRIYENISHHS